MTPSCVVRLVNINWRIVMYLLGKKAKINKPGSMYNGKSCVLYCYKSKTATYKVKLQESNRLKPEFTFNELITS